MSDWKSYMIESDKYEASLPDLPHKVYPVNPYVMVYENPEVSGIYHLFFNVHSRGASPWMTLVVGPERALLIDTAFGVGDLKGLVETLTDKPIDVVNTHFHGDHSAGNGQFEEIYIHKYDAPYLRQSLTRGSRSLPPEKYYRKEDVIPLRETRIREFEDGYVFCLGGDRNIEVIHAPGHSAGCCMLLDHKTGFLYSGDAVVFTPTLILSRFPRPYYSEYLTVTAFRDALKVAMPRLKGVTRLYAGHSVLGISPDYLTDMLACCEKIINHPEEHEYFAYDSEPPYDNLMCVGHAMIAYNDDRI